MKKRMFSFLLVLLLLSACSGEAEVGTGYTDCPSPSDSPVLQVQPSSAAPEDEITCVGGPPLLLACRVVDGAGEEELLLATLPQEGDIYAGVFRLTAEELSGRFWKDPVLGPDGRSCSLAAFEDIVDGMLLYVVCDDVDQSEYPGVFVGVRSAEIVDEDGDSPVALLTEPGRWFDLCGLYLQVLDDLWQADPSLNADISTAIVDLSSAPGGLTEQERAALVWRFGQLHGVTALDIFEPSVMERLEGAGYYAECGSEIWGLEDACLFTLRVHESGEADGSAQEVLRFDASKWRGPLAAYCFYDCTAVRPEAGPCAGYEIGAEMIS